MKTNLTFEEAKQVNEMNELNIMMKKAIENYCKKNNIATTKEQYGKFYYMAYITDNDCLICNAMENITSNKKLPCFYMKRSINGKQKRIPKNEW